MGFQFPINPNNGDVATTPSGVTFIWNAPAGGWIQSNVPWPPPLVPGDYVEWPENPQMGDTFTTPAGLEFVYTGEGWRISGIGALPSPYFLAGVGPPPNILGMEGNFYLDVSTGQLYGPYQGGAWPPPVDFAADEGPPGPAGPAGPQGAQGPAGAQGIPGPLGQEGPQGVPGVAGPQGPQGVVGIQGPPGQFVRIVGYFSTMSPLDLPPNGYFPINWDSALNPHSDYTIPVNGGLVYTPNQHVWIWVTPEFNLSGWVDLGTMGGVQGPIGPQGPIGSQGIQGVPGPSGAQGNAGQQGAQGIQGVQGIPGPAGPQGADGAPGQTAIIVGSFSNQPPSALPSDGFIPADWDTPGDPPDDYQMSLGQGLIDTNTQNIYTFVGTQVTASGWIPIGAVQGPPGPEGPAGVNGVNGAQGPPGVDGLQGIQGPEGPVGAQGVQGNPGAQGPQGVQGDPGIQGNPGMQGAQGVQGPEGPQGIPGQATIIIGNFTNNAPSLLPVNGYIPANWDSTGNPPADIQMEPGQSMLDTNTGEIWVFVGTGSPTGWIDLGGVQGPQGPEGPAGAQGPVGQQGPAGLNGLPGATGPQGVTGDPGPQGPTGPQGPQGVPGNIGQTGPEGPMGPPGSQGPPGVPGIPDAPADTKIYARQDNVWVPIPPGTEVVVQDYPPGSPNDGTLWYNSVDLQMYIWYNSGTHSQWVPVIPGGGLGGVTVAVSDTAPSAPQSGSMWFDTTQCQLYVNYNSAWVIAVNPGATAIGIDVGVNPPANPVVGRGWFNQSEAQLYVWSGQQWIIAVNTTGYYVTPDQPTINQPIVMGVTDGSNAPPGAVGEYVSNQATVPGYSYNVWYSPNSLALSAGDWMVTYWSYASGVGSVTQSLSLTTSSLASSIPLNSPPTIGAAAITSMATPAFRFSSSSSFTIYGWTNVGGSGGPGSVTSYLYALRMR